MRFELSSSDVMALSRVCYTAGNMLYDEGMHQISKKAVYDDCWRIVNLIQQYGEGAFSTKKAYMDEIKWLKNQITITNWLPKEERR